MFKVIGFVIKYLPVIISAVSAVEALAGSASGAEKKAAALALVRDFIEKTFKVKVSDGVLQVASEAIDVVVSAMNLFGIFKKGEEVPEEVKKAEEVVSATVKPASIKQSVEQLSGDKRIEELLKTDTFTRPTPAK